MDEKDEAVVPTGSSTSTPVADSSLERATRQLDPKIEKRILRRLDLTLIPMLWFLFVVSFADRSNIGNAKIAGMDQDLHLTGNRYNIAVMIFTLAYTVFGVPANVAFRVLGPRSLAGMMFIWGIFALCQGLVKTYGGLVACRFLMGVFEAGFVPGCGYLIGSWYLKDEFLTRYAVFFSGAIVAGAFNGLFSYALVRLDGKAGLTGWRWIFVVEGLVTCGVAMVVFRIMPHFPEHSNMFKGEEKAVLLERLKRDEGHAQHDEIFKQVLAALMDWKIWLATVAYFGAQENSSSIVAFLPSILKGLGYSSVSAQVHSIPVYTVAFVMELSCAYLSERLRQRYFFALFGGALSVTGLTIQLVQPHSVSVRYMATFLVAAGSYIVMPIIVVWNAINVGKGYKRVVSFAMTTAVANCGALISSNVYITGEAPKYPTGFGVGAGMACLSIISMTLLYFGLIVCNKQRDQEKTTDLVEDGDVRSVHRYVL